MAIPTRYNKRGSTSTYVYVDGHIVCAFTQPMLGTEQNNSCIAHELHALSSFIRNMSCVKIVAYIAMDVDARNRLLVIDYAKWDIVQ